MNKPELAIPGIILQKLNQLKLKLQGGYNAGKYWRDRFIEYGFDPRGVGNKSLSADENRRQYRKAGETLISLHCSNVATFKIFDKLRSPFFKK